MHINYNSFTTFVMYFFVEHSLVIDKK